MSTSCSSSIAANRARSWRSTTRGEHRRNRRSEDRLPWCRDDARASAGVSGPGRKAWGSDRYFPSLRGLEEAAAIQPQRGLLRCARNDNTLMRPEILNPLFTEVEALKGVGPQVAKLLKKLGLTRVVDLIYHLPTGSIERVLAPSASRGIAGPQRDPRPEAVRNPREPVRARADADLRLGRRRQHDQPHLFQQSGLGETAVANWPAAHGFGQARSLWRRMADHPPRGERARKGPAPQSASRSIR